MDEAEQIMLDAAAGAMDVSDIADWLHPRPRHSAAQRAPAAVSNARDSGPPSAAASQTLDATGHAELDAVCASCDLGGDKLFGGAGEGLG